MPCVLGIDAAWSAGCPSGISLLSCEPASRPRLLVTARSFVEYAQVLDGATPRWDKPPPHGQMGLREVLEATARKLGSWPLISIDIPLSSQPIAGRRLADQEVAREYGRLGATTHTPNPNRPGGVSLGIYKTLTGLGYQLATNEVCFSTERPLFLETYPHPAVIELLELDYRLPYKTSRRHDYWPKDTPARRWERLVESMTLLHRGLSGEVELAGRLPEPSFLRAARPKTPAFKGYEDALDATICAWVGAEFLRGRCRPLGGTDGTVWLPLPRRGQPRSCLVAGARLESY
ncbi:MAG: DUF429 domain-containing protein [Bacillota bacterium]